MACHVVIDVVGDDDVVVVVVDVVDDDDVVFDLIVVDDVDFGDVAD